jgi:hypothetical protein
MEVRIADDVVFRELAGEAVILNLGTGMYYGLDPVGTRFWNLIAEHGSTEKVIDALLTEYEVDERRLRQDLDELIRQFGAKGLVRASADDAPPAG